MLVFDDLMLITVSVYIGSQYTVRQAYLCGNNYYTKRSLGAGHDGSKMSKAEKVLKAGFIRELSN